MTITKKHQTMIKAVAAFNKAAGSERIVLLGNEFNGPRGTYESFIITVDGVKKLFSPVCRVSIKDFVTTMGRYTK
jgi:hypothetical protein